MLHRKRTGNMSSIYDELNAQDADGLGEMDAGVDISGTERTFIGDWRALCIQVRSQFLKLSGAANTAAMWRISYGTAYYFTLG